MTNKNGALFLLVISNLCFGLLPILVKVANHSNYSPMEEIFFRFVFGIFGVVVLWLVGWQSLKVMNWSWVFWRGIFGGISVIAYFTALQSTSAAEGTLLNYTYILWANVFSVWFLRQKPPQGFYLCLFTAIVGVDLVLGTRLDHVGFGEMAGIFSGITGGIAVLAIKKSRETDSALTVFASFAVFSWVLSSGALLWGNQFAPSNVLLSWSTPSLSGLGILMAIGAVSMTAQVLFTEALGRTSLALGSFLTLSVPVLATLFDWVLLGEPLSTYFWLGLFLVTFSCAFMVWRENKA